MSIEAVILLAAFLVLLALGVPIAFCIGLSSVITILMILEPGPAVGTMAQRVTSGMDSFVLLAIPFFVLAGEIMNRGGIARRIIEFAKSVVGPLPGGLAHVNIFSAMIFGALSGSAVAAASAIGGVMTPIMDEEGYDRRFCAAVNITSSTTGLIIPPSNILIVYSVASGGVSIAALFLAGYVPGLLVGLALMFVAAFIARRRKYPTAKFVPVRTILWRFVVALPSLGLVVVVIGGIVGGIFTATEAAAVAVVYALLLAFAYRELSLRDLPDVLLRSSVTTGIVMMLVGSSIAMSWVLASEQIPQSISQSLLQVSDHPIIVLIVINLILLCVGIFMDMTPAVLIFTPIFLPIVRDMGIDPIHFGIIMVFNLCIGICTPPVGSVLFVGCGVARIPIAKVVGPLLPFFAAMIIVLMLVTAFPSLSLWLPRMLGY